MDKRFHLAEFTKTLAWWNKTFISLAKLCPVIPISNQDGRQAKNRKKGGMKF
jgi:hypothetical protein